LRPAPDFSDRRSRPGASREEYHVVRRNSKLRLFFPPPYSPDRNPDELVWKHLKADTVGRSVATKAPIKKL
jgi:transposase